MTSRGFKWSWANVDASGDPMRYVGLLNQVRTTDDPSVYPSAMALIDAQPGEQILEIGCGNGALARAVARQVPTVAGIVATDFSVAVIREAQSYTKGRDLPVTYGVADAQSLPFEDATFDRAYGMELFVILPDPRRALEELARVTRPDGHICLWESDCDTKAYDAADLELTRRIQRFIGDHEYNGAVGRQLIGWCREMGFQVHYTPGIGVSENISFLRSALFPEWLDDAVRAGVVTSEEIERWLADLEQREAEGRFFSYVLISVLPPRSLTSTNQLHRSSRPAHGRVRRISPSSRADGRRASALCLRGPWCRPFLLPSTL